MPGSKLRQSIRTLTSISTALLAVVAMLIATVAAPAQTSGTWAHTGSLNFPRIGHTATLLANGQVLVAGGEDSQGNHIAAAELYNPATGTWTLTGSLATPRIDHTATLLPNGEVLVAGGVGTTYTASAELYNPLTGQWTATGSMTVPRAFGGAALMNNGLVLMAGGSNLAGTSNATAELYNPTTGKWTATTNMPSGQNSPAVLLPSGKVLVVGGILYNPSTAQWTATGPLYYSITGASAALLPNGDVLPTETSFPVTRPSTLTRLPTHGRGRAANAATTPATARSSYCRLARSFSPEMRSRTAVTPHQPRAAPSTTPLQIPGPLRDLCYRRQGARRHCFPMAKYCL